MEHATQKVKIGKHTFNIAEKKLKQHFIINYNYMKTRSEYGRK